MQTLKDLQNFNNETLKANTFETKKPFTRKRIRLDKARTFSDVLTDNNFTQPFRAFWVVQTSNDDFRVNMIVNPKNSLGDSLPLRPNMNFDFGQMVDGARFEFEAQSGGYVDILFFSIGYGQLGNVELTSSGSVYVSDGTTYDNGIYSVVSDTASLVVPADNGRGKLTLMNESSDNIYFGTEVNLNDVNFKEICPKIAAHTGVLEWTNKSGLYLRSETKTVNLKYFNEVI